MNSAWWRKWHAFWEHYLWTDRQKALRWINRLLILKGMSPWGKHVVVAAPMWASILRNSKTSGHKSNEALDCIFNQHWFPGSVDDHNSMSCPWLNISSVFDKVVEVIFGPPRVPVGIHGWFSSGHFTQRLVNQRNSDTKVNFHWLQFLSRVQLIWIPGYLLIPPTY